MSTFWGGSSRNSGRRRYSVNQLRSAYAELLSLIQVDPPDDSSFSSSSSVSCSMDQRQWEKPRGSWSASLSRIARWTTTSKRSSSPSSNNDKSNKSINAPEEGRSKKDLQDFAYRALSATRTVHQEKRIVYSPATTPTAAVKTKQKHSNAVKKRSNGNGNHNSSSDTLVSTGVAVAVMGDPQEATALKDAQVEEQKVVDLVHSIGQMVLSMLEYEQQRASVSGSGGRRQPQSLQDEQQLRAFGNDVFEYFCEKAILVLLVDMVQAKPINNNRTNESANAQQQQHHDKFWGVVWTPKVKAECIRTVSSLLSSSAMRDPSASYFLLSQNCINTLITSVLPLSQWTDPALELLLPPYVELLKNLALVLSDSPQLFCFFVVNQEQEEEEEEGSNQRKSNNNARVLFPLFSATLQTGTSSYAESNSFVHATCLNLMVDLMHIPDVHISAWVQDESVAAVEHALLAHHICDLLLQRYRRMANLTTGQVVDPIRSTALSAQIQGLNDQMDILNDVFECGIRGLNVRLCELLLERVVCILWRQVVFGDATGGGGVGDDNDGHQSSYDFSHNNDKTRGGSPPPPTRSAQHFLAVGMLDADVIPEREAMVQVAFFVLSTFFHRLRYRPLVRMLSIALFHPQTTTLWMATTSAFTTKQRAAHTNSSSSTLYRFTPALHRIAQMDEASKKSDEKKEDADFVPNQFRSQVMKAIGGFFGEWFIVPATFLVESVLRSPSLDDQTLSRLQLVPTFKLGHDGDEQQEDEELDEAVATCLQRNHTHKSEMSTTALECISSLAMHFVHKTCTMISLDHGNKDVGGDDSKLVETDASPASVLLSCKSWAALHHARSSFFRKTLESHHSVSTAERGKDIFVDYVETAVLNRYKPTTVYTPNNNSTSRGRMGRPTRAGSSTSTSRVYAYQLSQHGCTYHGTKAECLIRRSASASQRPRSDVVEQARWNTQMALHMRASIRVMDRFYQQQRQVSSRISSSFQSPHEFPKLELLDKAGELEQIFGMALETNSLVSSGVMDLDVDPNNARTFSFTSGGGATDGADTGAHTMSTPGNGPTEDAAATAASGQPSEAGFNMKLLVLDSAVIHVVRPLRRGTDKAKPSSQQPQRGKVVCRIPLHHVIAAAVDGQWLHVAVRHDNVGSLIKNGNMALCFDSTETCTKAHQHLSRGRQKLRRELAQKIETLFVAEDGPELMTRRKDEAADNRAEMPDSL